jgi:uncharacterized tellurite resistance protein B-like protein
MSILKINETKMQEMLDWAYDKSINGVPGTSSAIELAESYMNKDLQKSEMVESLVKWQITKSATSGFVTGLGGLPTLAIAVPANFASVIFIQLRMIGAIAHIGGFDIKDDKVRTFAYLCLTGNALNTIVKDLSIEIGTKVTTNIINKSITGPVLTKINQAVGFRLITKFGTKGALNLGKMVPVLGGVIGGSFDGVATGVIGKKAKEIFINQAVNSINNDEVNDKVTELIELELQKLFLFINLIKADGRVDRTEVEELQSLISTSEFNEDIKNKLNFSLLNTDIHEINYNIFKKHPASIPRLFYNLFDLTEIDGDIHEKEIEFVKDTAKKLDVSEAFVNDLFN